MKKKRFNKKLSLNKETISNLNRIKGGAGTNPCTATECWTDCMHTCSPTFCHCTELPNCNSENICQVSGATCFGVTED